VVYVCMDDVWRDVQHRFGLLILVLSVRMYAICKDAELECHAVEVKGNARSNGG